MRSFQAKPELMDRSSRWQSHSVWLLHVVQLSTIKNAIIYVLKIKKTCIKEAEELGSHEA